MGSKQYKNKLKIGLPIIFLILCLLPSLVWSAGYQEEKLFDGNFYSAEELRKKVEDHNKEIQIIDNQIKVLETDIDWLVLKINQIQDSGRTADSNLKKSITSKEQRILTLQKTKGRLEYMVQYYSASLGNKKEQGIEDILREKMPTSSIDRKETPVRQENSQIKVEDISPKKMNSVPSTTAPDTYDGISKTQLQTAINQAGLNDWVEIIGTGTCLRLETTLPILFPTGSAKIAQEYEPFFERLATFLKPYDVKVLVNGYADEVPIKNKQYPSNFELGATRAANIVHQMVNHGLKPSIFKVESTGKHRFAAKGMSNQKSLERRAEVTVIFSG
ncbi:MAG: OmpA family protein [Proteobacteria bacterium]|nr:OmpA family protein [Pseudomonadota bacterium]MBU1389456.1 OmpA family protein [Pseudomonadota bacterium]MBU1541276.1 OmpA family protein [Pseudomonadota bacterium]MBU2429324.1 OmpA family protein [Pseudomonadota bacterium]MBU2480098.1 OmpA family protein [Pseudomonadota bacterium]